MPKNYRIFAEQENRMNAYFKKTLFPTNIRELTKEQVDEIKMHIAGGLSPENLHCDGEATQAEVDYKLNHLHMLCREVCANTEFGFDINELEY